MMYLKYIPLAALRIIADLLAVILAPVAVLFVRGGRLPHFLKWITTHDAPIDSGHLDGYWATPTTAIELYWSRVKWIWRNPAYQVGHWLGYNQDGVFIIKHSDNSDFWDTGIPNRAFWTAINKHGQSAFLYEQQINWLFGFTLELQFGWKLYRKDPDNRCMLALRIAPFKRYL